MTTSVLVLRHLAFEDLGILESVLIEQGDQVRYLDIGVDPIDAEAIVAADLLVVLGGPIGVGDIELFPYLAQEIAAIDARLKVRRRTLGICLGAQLIAAARGERVYPSPGGVEIGFGPLDLTAAGAAGPLGEVAGTPVLHWHGDTFDLPGDAELLASTPACANQAFAIDDHVLALQFHVEADPARIEQWLIGHSHELVSGGHDIAKIREDAARYGGELAARVRAVLSSGWTDLGVSDLSLTFFLR